MITSRLAKSELTEAFDRSQWTLQQHCDYANAQMILKGIPEERRRKGLPSAHWVIRDHRVVIEAK